MVSIYGTFVAIVNPGAISPMLWVELAGSESLLARTKTIKRPAWRLASHVASLYKPFGCTVLKLAPKTSNKPKIGSARPKSVGTSYFTHLDSTWWIYEKTKAILGCKC